ncbi:MAG: hypothetical protein ACOX4L_08080 [Bacillota bacterium]|jgi:hypothetical protein
MKMTLIRLVLQGIPENIALVTLGFVLVKAKIEWKKIIVLGVILAISAFLVRLLPITFGLHTIINIILMVGFLNYFAKADITKSVVVSLACYIILILLETIIGYIIISFLDISLKTVLKNDFLVVLWGILQVICLFLISHIIYHLRGVE